MNRPNKMTNEKGRTEVLRRARKLRGWLRKSGLSGAFKKVYERSDAELLADASIPAEKRRRLFILKRIESWAEADWKAYAEATLPNGRNLEPRQAYLEIERAAGREPWTADLAPPTCEFALCSEPIDRDPKPVCDHCGRQMIFVVELAGNRGRGLWRCVSQVVPQGKESAHG